MTDYTKLIERMRTDSAFDFTTLGNEAADAIEALQADCAEHKENAILNARIAVSIRAERDALQAKLDAMGKGEPVVPASWTNLLAYVLQDDIHNRLTPRVIDIAYTAFTLANQPNTEDGGASDWFSDTKPHITKLIAKLHKDLAEELDAAPKALEPLTDERQPLAKALAAVREYMPPDGISAKDCLSKITAVVDPWPLAAKPLIALKDEEISLMAHNEDEGDWSDLRYRDCWHEGYMAGAKAAEERILAKLTSAELPPLPEPSEMDGARWGYTADDMQNHAIDAIAHGSAAQLAQEPTFFYRPTCNGEMYEGPHHARSVGGRMLREEKPTEWVALYTRREAK